MGCLLGRRAAAELGRCLTPALMRASRKREGSERAWEYSEAPPEASDPFPLLSLFVLSFSSRFRAKSRLRVFALFRAFAVPSALCRPAAQRGAARDLSLA